MRVFGWLVALVAVGLVGGFVFGLVRPRRGELPRPVTS